MDFIRWGMLGYTKRKVDPGPKWERICMGRMHVITQDIALECLQMVDRRVIIGDPSNGGNGDGAGHVRIYEFYPSESSESSADFPLKFLSVIGPMVGVIFILF